MKYDEAIKILSEAVKGELMKASIGGSGSLAESYCVRKAEAIQSAIALLEKHNKEDLP